MSSSIFSFRRYLTIFLLVTIMPLGLLAVASEYVIRTRVIPNDYLFRRIQLFVARSAADAAYGDSHVQGMLTGMPAMLNFGQGSDSIFDVGWKIRTYHHGQRGFRLILEGSPQMFRRNDGPRAQTLQYAGFGRTPLHVGTAYFRHQLPRIWGALWTNPEFRNRRVFFGDGGEGNPTRIAETAPDILAASITKEYADQRPPSGFQQGAMAREYEAIAAFLRERHAEVCILTTPLFPAYARIATQDPQFRLARSWFDALAERYRFKRVDIMDNRIDPKYFANADHINAAGAPVIGPLVYQACFGQPGERHAAIRQLGGHVEVPSRGIP